MTIAISNAAPGRMVCAANRLLDAVKGAHKVVSMPDGKTLDITIPPGISDGQVMRLKGQGLPGSDGQPGDAYVEISVQPHSAFMREIMTF